MQDSALAVADRPDSYLGWSRRGKAGVPRYVAGTVIAALLLLVGPLLALPLVVLFDDYDTSTLGQTVVQLAGFVPLLVGTLLMVRWLHGRPGWSVGSRSGRPDLRHMGLGFIGGLLPTTAVVLVAGACGLVSVHWVGTDWLRWCGFALVVTPLVLVQTSAEEVLFRGYLTQFTHRLVTRAYLPVLVPSVVFAALHIGNVAQFGGGAAAMLPYLISALLYGWAAYRSGSLWIAIGLHWQNNISSVLLIGTPQDVLATVAPFELPMPPLTTVTLLTLTTALATLAVVEWTLRRPSRRAPDDPQ